MDPILLLVANELLLASEWTGLIRAILWQAYLLTNSKEDLACGVTLQEEMTTLMEEDHPDRTIESVEHEKKIVYTNFHDPQGQSGAIEGAASTSRIESLVTA